MTWSPRNPSKAKPFEETTKVRYKRASLAKQSEQTQKRFAGRVGVIAGYRMGADDPIVDFPRDGRRKEQRVFELPADDLEVAEDE